MSTQSRFAALAPAQPWVSTAARLALGGIWIAAGAAKVTDQAGSIRSVRAYRLLPEGAAVAVGAGLPFLEIALGLLLILGVGVRLNAAVSAVLLTVFIAGIVSVAVRGLRIDCGCFGDGGELGATESTRYLPEIARDVGFLLLAGFLIRWPRSRFSVDGWLHGPTTHHEGDDQ